MHGRNESFPVGYYQNTFSAAGESEGSGSSGRMDAEFSASEDSTVPFRKCINLNSDKGSAFFVPSVVVHLSGMLPSERTQLIHRLKHELEQIRILQKKIDFQRANGVAVSSSLSCTNGKLGPKAVKKSASTSGPDKKAKPASSSKGPLVRDISGKFESAKQVSATQAADTMLMKRCENLLKQLMTHTYSWVFSKPVDVVALNIPDYLEVIKHPMDLGTVKGKLSSNAYSSPLEFVADVRLTFTNAMTYNPPGNDVHIMADTLSKYFEVRWKAIEKKLMVNDTQKLPLKSGPHEDKEMLNSMPPSKKRKVSSIQYEVAPEPAKPIMTDEEKHSLGRQLECMDDMPETIVDFLKEQSSNGRESGEEEIEIDIDDLSNDALLMLRKLVNDHLQLKQKNQVVDEQCEIEIVHEAGFSNSSMQPSKVNGDEDVDIGGNEPPVSSYTKVDRETGASLRDTKSTSLGSSSDSDSNSSTDSESDNAKVPNPKTASKVQETVCSEVQPDEKMSGSPVDVNKYSGLDQHEQTSLQKTNSTEPDSPQDGETAAGEGHVSPGKRYRAALLKNRFAETILKAKEKTLSQADKGDPEKLRKEKEELEMQRRKERARLQAEAKAAEDAQRQAEAKAVAEAKRKREQEREAARQALMKMEKTVEINENSRFLEDLEMLSSVPTDNLPSSAEETSPDLAAMDRLGSFNMGGSNPLEQLGLFMKDDDEDEEHEPQTHPSVNVGNDVEEGEIDSLL